MWWWMYLYGWPACIVDTIELVSVIRQNVQPTHFAVEHRTLCISNCIPATHNMCLCEYK
jgi:hypothetical protein